jgi:hypothetical protein
MPTASEVCRSKGGHAGRNEYSLFTRRCTKAADCVTEDAMR